MSRIAIALALAVLPACSKKEEDKEAIQLLPLVGEAVDKARPAGITAASLVGLDLAATPNEAAEALRDFFNDNVGSLGGHVKKGWIDAYIYDLDQRILETKNDTEPDCLASAPVSIAFDTGVGYSTTLKLNCVRSFEGSGDQSGPGSGIAYGRDDAAYYMYVMLSQKANAKEKFGYAAIVNRTTEAVDLLFLDRNPTFNRSKFFSLKTAPEPKSFAFAVAGTGDGPGPASTATTHTLSPGSRFIANATHLRADGLVGSGTDATGAVQNSPAEFDENDCFDATNLAAAPAACPSGAPAFPASLPLVPATALPAQASVIDATLKTMNELVTAGVAVDLPPPPPPPGS
jgi:hypothetical protein